MVGVKVTVMCLCGFVCAWPLLSLGQPIFAYEDHVCIGEMVPVLMVDLVSLMLHWSTNRPFYDFFDCFMIYFGGVTNEEQLY